jgi:hypothetical protein
MINALIALVVIAIFTIGLLCALDVISCGKRADHSGRETK